MSVRFVAEVSSNSARDLEPCFAIVDAAADAGCSGIIKFHLCKISEVFVTEMLWRSPEYLAHEVELSAEFVGPIAERSNGRGLDFVRAPSHLDVVEQFLLFVDAHEIASCEPLWPAR